MGRNRNQSQSHANKGLRRRNNAPSIRGVHHRTDPNTPGDAQPQPTARGPNRTPVSTGTAPNYDRLDVQGSMTLGEVADELSPQQWAPQGYIYSFADHFVSRTDFYSDPLSQTYSEIATRGARTAQGESPVKTLCAGVGELRDEGSDNLYAYLERNAAPPSAQATNGSRGGRTNRAKNNRRSRARVTSISARQDLPVVPKKEQDGPDEGGYYEKIVLDGVGTA